MSWRFVNAAVRGTSHVRAEMPCQDDCLVDVIGGVLVAIASDGAGSAQCAEEGSGLVCETLLPEVERWLSQGAKVGELTRETVLEWLQAVRVAIIARASEKALTPRDFACTLVAAIVSRDAAACLQIGDGGIVIGKSKTYEVIFWPDGGEYANTTFFLTDDAWPDHLHFTVRNESFDDLALMTDGMQRLALHFATRTAHGPFFTPLFGALGSGDAGYAADLEPALVAFLDSNAVNERTDDDKTLVLATRREESGDAAR